MNRDNVDKYCMYLRKSRKDDDSRTRNESDEETLARHKKTLFELAEREQIDIEDDAIYQEVVSGDSISARPVMQQLLKDVSEGIWRGVLVVEVERLARGDTSDQGQVAKAFKYSDTLIITPNKTYDPTNEQDEDYFEFGLFMSRREYRTINRRLQAGRERSVKDGKYVGNKPPYGYEREKLPKGFTLKENPEEAEVIRMIFEWYTIGVTQPDGTNKRLGVSLIVRKLDDLKILSKTGNKWTVPSIRDILINPTYAGKLRWNWRKSEKKYRGEDLKTIRPRSADYILVDGLHKGIISEETFELAQVYMKQNPARPIGERGVVKNPLSGLVVCGMCKRRMVRRPYGSGYQDTLMCPVTSCKNVSSHLSIVEDKILDGLKEWIADYKLQWQIEDTPKKERNSALEMTRKALIKLDAEIKKLKEQQSNLDDLVEQGVYTAEKYKQRTTELEQRIKQAEADYKELQVALAIEEIREESRKIIIPNVEYLLETYHALPTPQAKNDLLKEVLEKVVYTKTKGGRWHSTPDDLHIILYPKLPHSNP